MSSMQAFGIRIPTAMKFTVLADYICTANTITVHPPDYYTSANAFCLPYQLKRQMRALEVAAHIIHSTHPSHSAHAARRHSHRRRFSRLLRVRSFGGDQQ